MLFTRADSLDTFRLAVFLCNTPLFAARAISGWAVLRAAVAASLSPDAIASSTLRMCVFVRDRRDVLISVRRAIFRTIFFADFVFAIDHSLSNVSIGSDIPTNHVSSRLFCLVTYVSLTCALCRDKPRAPESGSLILRCLVAFGPQGRHASALPALH